MTISSTVGPYVLSVSKPKPKPKPKLKVPKLFKMCSKPASKPKFSKSYKTIIENPLKPILYAWLV